MTAFPTVFNPIPGLRERFRLRYVSKPPFVRLGRWFASATLAASVALQPSMSAAAGLIRDSEIENTLRAMILPIYRAADLNPDSVRLFIINDPSINAFVAGGKNMFLHTGLLRTLETPEEVIGVMAHETGHITGGHLVRRIAAIEEARSKAIAATILGIAAAVAGAGQAGTGIVGLGNNLAQRQLLAFTRTQESSADAAALTFMERADIDPSAMIRVLERLERNQSLFVTNVDPYNLTHPLSRDRIEQLARGVERSPARGRRVSEDLQYWHARMRAKLDGFLSRPGSRNSVSFGSAELDLYREAISLHRLPAPDRALTAVDRLIDMRPRDPYYWELKGQFLIESGRGAQAIDPYRRAVQLAPNEPLIAGGLGRALLTANDATTNTEALQVLERAALQDPFDGRIKRSLAEAYQRADNPGMAAIVTAERLALEGDRKGAVRQARVAKASLPVGSPGDLRAEDIIDALGRSGN